MTDELDEHSAELVAVVGAVVPGWIERSIARFGVAIDGQARRAGMAAAEEAMQRLLALFALDVEAQQLNPLAVLRAVTHHATDVLRRAGVPPVRRDEFRRRSFPDDVYDLVPATWSDIDERLHEPGIVWGAWKASTVAARHRRS